MNPMQSRGAARSAPPRFNALRSPREILDLRARPPPFLLPHSLPTLQTSRPSGKTPVPDPGDANAVFSACVASGGGDSHSPWLLFTPAGHRLCTQQVPNHLP